MAPPVISIYVDEPTVPPNMTLAEYARLKAQSQRSISKASVLAPIITAWKKRLS